MIVPSGGDQWIKGIGGSSLLEGLTVIAYFTGAWFCAAAGRARRRVLKNKMGQESRFWYFFGILFFMFGVSKELKLQSLLLTTARTFAREHGWYLVRGALQTRFIVALGLSGLVMMVYLTWLVRNHLKSVWPALLGGGLLVTFVAIRAVSFHDVDRFLLTPMGSMQLNQIFELGGIACVTGAAAARNYFLRYRYH